MKYAYTLVALLAVACLSAKAGTERVVDVRSFTTPIVTTAKSDAAQTQDFIAPVQLNTALATTVFSAGDKQLTLTNVPMPPGETATLHLELCRPVFDANTKFLWSTPQGKKAIKVRPIYSYKGTVEGEPGSRVSLHYSEGDLKGFIIHEDGTRTLIGPAPEYRATQGVAPHAFEKEGANARPLALETFRCGSDELPADERAAVTAMAMPSSTAKGESVQAWPLKEMRLAIVLREDVDSVLRLQGLDEEEVAQHFAKIVAAMSQAYEEDLGVHMYIGQLLAYTEDAPSGYLYNGKDPGKLLNEFSLDWSSGYDDVERTVAHLYCFKRPVGGLYVGGIAYGGQSGTRLCNYDHQGGYGVSTMDLNVNQEIPGAASVRNAFVWDVYVATHEIGHNVGSPHTHNCYWSPPVDTCQLQGDGTDACYSDASLRRVRPGTIMSYCHLVNGSSTPLTFGSRVSERMRTWIDASCMKTVSDPMVGLTSPRGTEDWAGGAKVTIKWVSANVSNVDLSYSLNGTSGWVPIAKGLNAADGSYLWTVPSVNTTSLWVRISSSSDEGVQNISLASYTIKVPLAITAPNGGERLGIGTEFQIRWSRESSVTAVNISFSSDDGATWQTVSNDVSGVTYTWTVPDAPTTTGRIKLVSTTNSTLTSTSQPFAIGTPRFELLLPKEGGQLCNNYDNQFNWSGDFMERIKIQYSTDDGASWRNALQPLTVGVSQWEIFSRNSSMTNLSVGQPVKLRVVESSTDKVLSTRDVLTIASCSAVTGVDEEPSLSASLSVANVSPNPASGDVTLSILHASEVNVTVVAVDASGSETVLIPSVLLRGSDSTSLNVSLSSLPAGAYQLAVRGNGAQASIPVRVVR